MEREKKEKEVNAKAQLLKDKVLDALVGNKASIATESFRKRLRNGDLDNNQIE